MYVCVCLLMKRSVNFDTNNGKFTKKSSMSALDVYMGSVPMKLLIKMLETEQDFSVEFSFVERLQGTY